MYNSDTNFEEIKERYIQIVNSGIPEDIETFAIDENDINICDLIVKVGFSNSRSEAKRMIQGKGIKVNSKKLLTNSIKARYNEYNRNRYLISIYS